ncbi:MAG TPA: cytochrome c biogenesis protein CcsA [Verrucomicrobiae bacterium]|nr:cytochrome c biogenesis protein CcsA [Verrucomicrobiae bacterium]
MNAVLFDVALTAYILAAVAAIGSLAGRRDQLAWIGLLLTQAGWICHTGAVILRGIELRRLPFSTLAEMISLLIWAVILLDFWVERHRRVRPLSAFVLPVVLALGLGLPTGLRSIVLEPPVDGWIMVHVALLLVGLAALVLNFGGALMYLVVERQLKAKRPGAGYHRLPPLETLDRLTVATLTVAFPFLTVGLALGVLSARRAWGSVIAFDPLALFSMLMWVIYAATLLGRALGHWRGRRAAYFSIAGFCVMLATLSAGVFLHGRHGS